MESKKWNELCRNDRNWNWRIPDFVADSKTSAAASASASNESSIERSPRTLNDATVRRIKCVKNIRVGVGVGSDPTAEDRPTSTQFFFASKFLAWLFFVSMLNLLFFCQFRFVRTTLQRLTFASNQVFKVFFAIFGSMHRPNEVSARKAEQHESLIIIQWLQFRSRLPFSAS